MNAVQVIPSARIIDKGIIRCSETADGYGFDHTNGKGSEAS